jgi:hypothetical protein
MEQSETTVIANLAEQKCPYLAGRPPHGTFKLWPSSINVCYGRRQEGKTYGHVSKETQEQRCFGGNEVYCRCPDYEQALAAALAPPKFGRALRPGEEDAGDAAVQRVRKTRRRRRRHTHGMRHVYPSLVFFIALCATLAVVTLLLLR